MLADKNEDELVAYNAGELRKLGVHEFIIEQIP